MGKIGAFVGTYVFPYLIADAGDDVIKQGQYPFYLSSALCIFSAIIALVFLPTINQYTVEEEDSRFRTFLEENGYDTSTMGSKEYKRTHPVGQVM